MPLEKHNRLVVGLSPSITNTRSIQTNFPSPLKHERHASKNSHLETFDSYLAFIDRLLLYFMHLYWIHVNRCRFTNALLVGCKTFIRRFTCIWSAFSIVNAPSSNIPRRHRIISVGYLISGSPQSISHPSLPCCCYQPRSSSPSNPSGLLPGFIANHAAAVLAILYHSFPTFPQSMKWMKYSMILPTLTYIYLHNQVNEGDIPWYHLHLPRFTSICLHKSSTWRWSSMDPMGKQPELTEIQGSHWSPSFINSALSSSNSFTRDSALLSCFFIFSWDPRRNKVLRYVWSQTHGWKMAWICLKIHLNIFGSVGSIDASCHCLPKKHCCHGPKLKVRAI